MTSSHLGHTTCPVCQGWPMMTGDGSGWDGVNYHHPPCELCDDQGEVPEVVARKHLASLGQKDSSC